MRMFPQVKFSSIVDDLAHVNWMMEQSASNATPLSVFIDLNVGMNRTGIGNKRASIEFMQAHQSACPNWKENPIRGDSCL